MDILKIFKLIPVLCVLLVLASCSSSDGGNSATTGRVSLLITDAPTDEFDQVNLTVESISFLGEDDGHETIIFNESRVVNLLALQNHSDIIATAVIPVGTYDKIRLHISQVELVKFTGEGLEPISCITKRPANGHVDLNPRGTFDVIGDGHLVVELDIDAEKSIHIVGNRKGEGECEYRYNFRPVVFVNILAVEDESKLVILDGKVLARTETGFQLCEREAVEVNDSCLAVAVSDNSVVQNDLIDVVPDTDVNDDDMVIVLGMMGSSDVDALHIVIEDRTKDVSDLALLTGEATSAVDAGDFTMNTDGDNAIVPPDTALTISLVEGSGVRIFDKFGKEVSAGTIDAGKHVDVFGLVMPEAKVKAAFVIVDNNERSDKTAGTIAAINDDSQITVLTDTVGGTADVCVDVTDAIIFKLGVVDGKVVTQEILFSELSEGMTIDVYGQDDGLGGCIAADVVLVADPLAVPLGAT
ncbi:MAG: DUF4382 domain-containing protein, partial [Gammaproteobacteria bacterium]|nr:DUF4382 domain-containing protein [Gammaproteobacteria bacterium]